MEEVTTTDSFEIDVDKKQRMFNAFQDGQYENLDNMEFSEMRQLTVFAKTFYTGNVASMVSYLEYSRLWSWRLMLVNNRLHHDRCLSSAINNKVCCCWSVLVSSAMCLFFSAVDFA